MKNLKYLSFILLLSCTTPKKDPLENSKRLISEGHKSLYQNGAFEVPLVNIKLIPPAPKTLNLALELSGINARDSFLLYLDQAQKSMQVIYDGTKDTYSFSKEVHQDTKNALKKIGKSVGRSSKTVLYNGKLGLDIIGKSFSYAGDVASSINKVASEMRSDLKQAADSNNKDFDAYLLKLDREQKTISKSDRKIEKFIAGYVSLPDKLKENLLEIKGQASLENFSQKISTTENLRKEYSAPMTYLISDTAENYLGDIKTSFSKSQHEITNEPGTLGALKAFRWVLDGLFWQGLIKPLTKSTAGVLGYVLVNGVAYPVMLVTANGITMAEIAVEVIQETLDSSYLILAPSAELALSAVLSGSVVMGQQIHKGAVKVAKPVTTGLIKGSGLLVSESTRYIGIPFASTLVATGGTLTGVAVGAGSTVAAGSLATAGAVAQVSSEVITPIVSSTVMVAGVTAYTLIGTTQVAYEVAKAAIVPPGLVLGSGMVLSYGSLVHLAAHSALAVSDCAYVVLSMEGPNWVLYAVKGKLGNGQDLSQKTVLNLEEMQKQGEEFYKVPVTSEEMEKIIDSALE